MKRRGAVIEKRRAKSTENYLKGGGKSPYAKKHAEQCRGKYRLTSPLCGKHAEERT